MTGLGITRIPLIIGWVQIEEMTDPHGWIILCYTRPSRDSMTCQIQPVTTLP